MPDHHHHDDEPVLDEADLVAKDDPAAVDRLRRLVARVVSENLRPPVAGEDEADHASEETGRPA